MHFSLRLSKTNFVRGWKIATYDFLGTYLFCNATVGFVLLGTYERISLTLFIWFIICLILFKLISPWGCKRGQQVSFRVLKTQLLAQGVLYWMLCHHQQKISGWYYGHSYPEYTVTGLNWTIFRWPFIFFWEISSRKFILKFGLLIPFMPQI